MTRSVPVPGPVLGVGTDLVDVGRLRDALARQRGLQDRLFTEDELAYAGRHRDPAPHLAARFAAKEAVMKALGAGMSTMDFVEIAVTRAESGAPSVQLSGRAAAHAESMGVDGFHLSLTHTDTTAHAIAMALAAPGTA